MSRDPSEGSYENTDLGLNYWRRPHDGPFYRASPSKAAVAGDKWRVATRQDPMADKPIVTATLAADGEIRGWLAKATPNLIIRCRDQKAEAYVVTGMAAQPELGNFREHTVRLRFDDSNAERETWHESTNDKALFSPNAERLARMVAMSKTLKFEFTPFRANPTVATFDVRGFNRHMSAVVGACDRPRPTTSSMDLLGDTKESILATLGDPARMVDERWFYATTDGTELLLDFTGGKVTGVQPNNVPLKTIKKDR